MTYHLPSQAAALDPIVDTQTVCFEDLTVGDRWVSDWRTITAADVAEFAALTGDHDPLHQSDCVAPPFGEPVAHGLLGLSVLAGLSTEHPRAATLALVGISEWRFEAPIFFGDQVRVVTEVIDVERHGRRAGRVTWRRELVNQDNRIVQRGDFVSLVATRSRQKSSSPASATTSQRGTLPAR
ncbi:MAG: MaoC/PaaZ C-terminal domain-containing protein [Planctomycetota bacterium]